MTSLAAAILRAVDGAPAGLRPAELLDDPTVTAICTAPLKSWESCVRLGLVRSPVDGLWVLSDSGAALLAALDAPAARPSRAVRNTLRMRIWRAIRQHPTLTLDDAVRLATRGTERGARDQAAKYLNALTAAGILVRLAAGPGGRWALAKDLGPLTPQYDRARGIVRDRNSGRTFSVATTEEQPA